MEEIEAVGRWQCGCEAVRGERAPRGVLGYFVVFAVGVQEVVLAVVVPAASWKGKPWATLRERDPRKASVVLLAFFPPTPEAAVLSSRSSSRHMAGGAEEARRRAVAV
jgi:hypothetical protein